MAANPGIQEQMEAQMRKMFQKTFTLDFTKSESMYEEEQELDELLHTSYALASFGS